MGSRIAGYSDCKENGRSRLRIRRQKVCVKEQIESVGGRFIEVEGMDDFEDESGYAKFHTNLSRKLTIRYVR